MRGSSIIENVTRRETLSLRSILPISPIQSTIKKSGGVMIGIQVIMAEHLILRDHFLSNYENSIAVYLKSM